MLDDEHLLRAGREAGDRLCQFILEDDEIVAVLIWCGAACHLQDRDTIIGWDPATRAQRLRWHGHGQYILERTNKSPNS